MKRKKYYQMPFIEIVLVGGDIFAISGWKYSDELDNEFNVDNFFRGE